MPHISPLKSVGLHPLKGNRRGQWAIAVNGPWRICFRFKGGDAHEEQIMNRHLVTPMPSTAAHGAKPVKGASLSSTIIHPNGGEKVFVPNAPTT
jgi:hypothetical protein